MKSESPNNLSSIIHITDALSINIQTNIINNIKINYFKYIKEYIKINLEIDFKDNNIEINNIIINSIYNDFINGSFNCYFRLPQQKTTTMPWLMMMMVKVKLSKGVER